MEPTSHFWTYLFTAIAATGLVGVVIAVVALKVLVFRPAEKRVRGINGPEYKNTNRAEIASLMKKMNKASDKNVVAEEVAKNKLLFEMKDELIEPLRIIQSEALEVAKTSDIKSVYAKVNGIGVAAKTLESLLNDLFELYELEVDRTELSQEKVSVPRVVDEILEELSGVALKAENSINVKLNPAVGTVITDYSKLRKLIRNMLICANDFTHRGNINLDISFAEDGKLKIDVKDDGGGEANHVGLEKLHCLRLPLTKKIAEFLGGRFSLEQGAAGGGRSLAFIHVKAV